MRVRSERAGSKTGGPPPGGGGRATGARLGSLVVVRGELRGYRGHRWPPATYATAGGARERRAPPGAPASREREVERPTSGRVAGPVVARERRPRTLVAGQLWENTETLRRGARVERRPRGGSGSDF